MKVVNRERCVCCDGEVLTYRRFIHSAMVLVLQQIYDITLKRGRGAVIESRDIPALRGAEKKSTDAVYFKYWGFVEQPGRAKWVLTPRGERFISGRKKAPAYLDIRKHEVVGEASERVLARSFL